MGATEEQMALLAAHEVTHVSYILLLYSVAFLLFLFVNMLLYLYATYTWPIDTKAIKIDVEDVNGGLKGGLNGHVKDRDRRVRDAEEFELEGLMSEGEEDEGSRGSSPIEPGRKETQRI